MLHYFKGGRSQGLHGRSPGAEAEIAIRDSGLFDEAYYLKTYPDIAAAKIDPLAHYVEYGASEGRRPNREFDPKFYANEAKLRPGGNALLHYLAFGREQGLHGRSPGADTEIAIHDSGLFDEAYYLRTYSDIAAAKVDPLAHYVEHGASEGRWPNADFDPGFYAAGAKLKAGENPLRHYIETGRALGLPTAPR